MSKMFRPNNLHYDRSIFKTCSACSCEILKKSKLVEVGNAFSIKTLCLKCYDDYLKGKSMVFTKPHNIKTEDSRLLEMERLLRSKIAAELMFLNGDISRDRIELSKESISKAIERIIEIAKYRF